MPPQKGRRVEVLESPRLPGRRNFYYTSETGNMSLFNRPKNPQFEPVSLLQSLNFRAGSHAEPAPKGGRQYDLTL